MHKSEILFTDKAPAAIGPYSQAVRFGPFVFVSGQIPLDPASGQMVEGDVQTQTHQVLNNLREVLKAAGGNLGNIVKTSIFIKNMDDFNKINTVYNEYFGNQPPARSTVEVSRLPKDVLVEIEAIAAIPPKSCECGHPQN